MSRRLVTLFFILLLCLSSGLGLAAQAAPSLRQAADRQYQLWTVVKSKVAEVERHRIELRSRDAALRTKLVVLRQEVTVALRNPDRFTPEQLVAVKDGLAALAAAEKTLTVTHGAIRAESIALRRHKLIGDARGVLNDLNRIARIQNIRLKALNEAVSAVDGLHAALRNG